MNKKTLISENKPFKESMSRTRQFGYNRKRHGDYFWSKIDNLLKSYIGREFSDFYKKVKPMLKSESNPMSYILDYWFTDTHYGESDYSIIDGIIVCNINQKARKLPYNVFEHNNDFYLITEKSKIGSAIYYQNGFIINPNYKSKYNVYNDNEKLTFKDFYNYFEKGSKIQDLTYKGITKFEADYFLRPELFNYITCFNWIIDLSKCTKFENRYELNKYFTRNYYEKLNTTKKIEREELKAKKEKAENLLGEAMIGFNLKKEKEKQLQKELQEKEEIKNNFIRDAKGFDKDSFKYRPKEVKY